MWKTIWNQNQPLLVLIEGSLEVKLPTIMDRWRDGKSQRREEKKKEDQKRESLRRKKLQVRVKVGKSWNTVFFPLICGSGGSKSSLAKAAGAEPAGQMRDEKLHAVVARSRFASEKAKNTSRLEHFWKLRCRKSASCCGAKHISKSKCTKQFSLGALLEAEMSKKCTLLWREAQFDVKMYKTHQVQTVFGSWDVEKVHAVVARSTFRVKMLKALHVRTTFGRSDVLSRGRRKGLCTWPKVSKTWGFCGISKNDGRRWDIWRGSAKMHFLRQAQYKRHVHQSC